MQVKKPEVEETLLDKAETEFYTYGFEHASIRRIIRDASMSIGNFYNYFENKEALFSALVNEEYKRFVHFLSQQEHEHGSVFSSELLNMPDWKQQLPVILDQMLPEFVSSILPDFTVRFVILIEGSKGTRYENTGDRLVNLIKEHLLQHLHETGTELPGEYCELLAQQFLSGLIRIIKLHINNKEERKRLFTHYMVFFVMGVAGLLGMGK